MAARIIVKVESNDLRKIAERLREYATNCDDSADKLEKTGSDGVVTDGFSSTVDGITRIRKFLRDFVGELGLPPDDLPALLEEKVQAFRSSKISADIRVAEKKLKYHRKTHKKDG